MDQFHTFISIILESVRFTLSELNEPISILLQTITWVLT